MKLVAALALVLMLLPAGLRAQEATPTPNPLVFDDIAMHFEAPAGYYLMGQQKIDLKELPDDPATVAAWLGRGRDNVRKIVLQQQHFEGTLDVFESVMEQQVRGDSNDAVVRGKERMGLKNGMPAYFITLVAGSGFTTTKSFIVAWIDGQRGCALILTAQLGDIDAATAKAILSDLRAVQYPVGRDE